MEKIRHFIGKLVAAYVIGLFLAAWFYIPAMALEEIINTKTIGWKDILGYLFAFSMSAVIGWFVIEQCLGKDKEDEDNILERN